MAESTIDKLQIEIEAESKKAATSLDDFIGKLEKMQKAVGDLQVGKLNDLKSALKGLASISIKGATKEMGDFGAQIDKLVTKANRKLEKELVSSFSIASSKAKKEIHSIIASMTEMEKTGFKTGDQNAFTQLSTDMVDLTDVVRSSISTMDEQLADFFEYWKSLKPIYISEKIVTDAKHTGEWQEAVHSYVGKFTTDINKMGAELDKVYQEMQEMYPNLFPSGTELTGASQFTQLLEVLHQCKKAIEETSEAEMEFGNRVDSVGPTIMGRYTELEAQINETKKAQSELAESTPETTFDLGGLASLTSAVKNLVKSAGDDKSQNSFVILEANIKNLCEAAKGAESIRGFNDALSGLNKAMANAPKSANFEPLAKSLTTLSKVNTEGLQGLSNVDGENIRKVVDAFNGFTFTGDFSGLTEALKSFPTKAKLTSFTNGINTISEANSGKAVDALNTFANATSSENISGIGEAIKGFPTENRLVSFSNGLNAIARVDGSKVAGVLNRIGSATYSDGITNLGEAIKNFPSEAKVAKFADSIYDLGVLNAGGLSALLNVFKDSSFGDGIKALGDGIRNLPSGKAIETLPDKFEKLGVALERIKDIDITNIATAAQALSNVTASADGAASIAALATALKDLRSEANSEKAKIVDDDDVEDVNGYSSELEELIAKIREYKATISGMERGKIDFDEDTYNEAVSQIKALEDQLKDYKVSLQDAESTGGGFDAVSDTAQQAAQDIHDAVQAARDFNNAASNANDPTLNGSGAGVENIKVYSSEIEELIAKIKEYKATISGMESGKIAFDNDKYDEAVSQIGILNEKLKEYKQALADTERENEEAKNYFDNLDDSIIQMSVDYAVNQKAASLFGNIMSGVKSALSALAGGLKTVGSGLLSLGEHFAKVGVKAASFVATIGKTILKITTMGTSFNKLKGKVQSLSKSLEGLNKKLSRMTRLFTMMAIRKLYTAVFDEVGEAIEHLALKSENFNEKVSELISSCKYLGHTVAAMAEPLLNVFGDALTTIIDKLATAISYVNQFLAAISGKTYYTAAKKVAEDYAESLDDASDSASSLNKQLQGFNELNNLTSSSSSSSGDDDSLEDCYETLEINSKILEIVEQIKEACAELFAPMKESWEQNGEAVMSALQNALDSCKEVIESMGTSFMNVWTNGTGLETCNNILAILEDIFNWVGDIATAWTNAWNNNGTGESYLQSIFDKLNSILSLIDTISDSFAEVWNNGTGETILSNMLTILTNINNIVVGLATSFKNAWDSAGIGTSIIQGIADIFTTIQTCVVNITDSLAKWASDIDWEPLLEALDGLMEALKPLADDLGAGLEWLFENVLEPLADWALESAIPAAIDAISSAIEFIDAVIEAAKPGLKWLWDNFLKPIAEWTGGVIVDTLNSLADTLDLLSQYLNGDLTWQELKLKISFGVDYDVDSEESDEIEKILDEVKKTENGTPSQAIIEVGLQRAWDTSNEAWQALKLAGLTLAIDIQARLEAFFDSNAWSLIYIAGKSVKTVIEIELKKISDGFDWLEEKKLELEIKLATGATKVLNLLGALFSYMNGSGSLAEVAAAFAAWMGGGSSSSSSSSSSSGSSSSSSSPTYGEGTLRIEIYDELEESLKELFPNLQSDGTLSLSASLEKSSIWDTDAYTALTSTDKTSTVTGKAVNGSASTLSTLKSAWNTIETKNPVLTAKSVNSNSSTLSTVNTSWSSIGTKTSTLTAKTSNSNSGTLSTVKTSWGAIGTKTSTLTAKTSNSNSGVLSTLVTGWNTVKTATRALTAKSTNSNSGVLSTLVTGWNTVKTATRALTAKATNSNSGVLSTLKTAWGTIKTSTVKLTAKATNSNTTVLSTLKSAWTTIVTKTAKLTAQAKMENESVFDKISSIWSTITSTVASLFSTTSSGKAEGGIFSNGSWKDIPQYASGTLNAGSLFVAGEAGAELVGHVGGQTEVLNQSQLAAVMKSAVVSAFAQYIPLLNSIYSRMAECSNAIISAETSSANYIANTCVAAIPSVSDITGVAYTGSATFSSEDKDVLKDIVRTAVEEAVGTYMRRIADNTDDMDVNVQIGDKPIFNSVRKSANEYYARTGKPAFAQ